MVDDVDSNGDEEGEDGLMMVEVVVGAPPLGALTNLLPHRVSDIEVLATAPWRCCI